MYCAPQYIRCTMCLRTHVVAKYSHACPAPRSCGCCLGVVRLGTCTIDITKGATSERQAEGKGSWRKRFSSGGREGWHVGREGLGEAIGCQKRHATHRRKRFSSGGREGWHA